MLVTVGVGDRSSVVRYRSFRVLATSQTPAAYDFLIGMDITNLSTEDRENYAAALLALEERNQHLFDDRKGAGNRFIRIDFVSPEKLANKFGNDWDSLRREQVSEIKFEANRRNLKII